MDFISIILFLVLGTILVFSLVKAMERSIKKWSREDAEMEEIMDRIRLAAKFCAERPMKKTPRRVLEHRKITERRLEKLRAKSGYYKKK